MQSMHVEKMQRAVWGERGIRRGEGYVGGIMQRVGRGIHSELANHPLFRLHDISRGNKIGNDTNASDYNDTKDTNETNNTNETEESETLMNDTNVTVAVVEDEVLYAASSYLDKQCVMAAG